MAKKSIPLGQRFRAIGKAAGRLRAWGKGDAINAPAVGIYATPFACGADLAPAI